jgi:hypothetical protein
MVDMQTLKKNFETKGVKNFACETCNSKSYEVKGFVDGLNSCIAHLRCSHCASECDFVMLLQPDGTVAGIKSKNV